MDKSSSEFASWWTYSRCIAFKTHAEPWLSSFMSIDYHAWNHWETQPSEYGENQLNQTNFPLKKHKLCHASWPVTKYPMFLVKAWYPLKTAGLASVYWTAYNSKFHRSHACKYLMCENPLSIKLLNIDNIELEKVNSGSGSHFF